MRAHLVTHSRVSGPRSRRYRRALKRTSPHRRLMSTRRLLESSGKVRPGWGRKRMGRQAGRRAVSLTVNAT